IQGPSGDQWYRIGTELRRVRNGKVTSYTVPPGGRSAMMLNQLREDRQGRLWIGTSRDQGELWMLKHEKMTRYTRFDGLPQDSVVESYEDHEGTMWFATRAGLVCFKDGKFSNYTTAQGMSSNAVEAICEDREGTLW